MSKKFTEEQYQKIINIYELQSDYVDAIRLVLNYIDELNWLGYEEALAIANPLTREWAHDKFVEKEKKYYWKLKGNWEFALVSTRALVNLSLHNKSKLTESEIREWGYNPDMFDKEEV